LEQVGESGYRSLTYGAGFVPDLEERYFCQNESQGRECFQNDCRDVHINDFMASGKCQGIGNILARVNIDNDILTKMLATAIGENGEQISENRAELLTYIRSLASQSLEELANEVVKFRHAKAPDRILDWHKFTENKGAKSKKRKKLAAPPQTAE
jgi:hypothetical protein